MPTCPVASGSERSMKAIACISEFPAAGWRPSPHTRCSLSRGGCATSGGSTKGKSSTWHTELQAGEPSGPASQSSRMRSRMESPQNSETNACCVAPPSPSPDAPLPPEPSSSPPAPPSKLLVNDPSLNPENSLSTVRSESLGSSLSSKAAEMSGPPSALPNEQASKLQGKISCRKRSLPRVGLLLLL